MVNLNLADKNEKVLTEITSNPTEKLWRSVLKQAFEDAFLGAKLHLCNYERQDARDFVSKRSTNFDYVCEMAGLWRIRILSKRVILLCLDPFGFVFSFLT